MRLVNHRWVSFSEVDVKKMVSGCDKMTLGTSVSMVCVIMQLVTVYFINFQIINYTLSNLYNSQKRRIKFFIAVLFFALMKGSE